MKGKYLITTDAWFTGPDGNDYRSVWGEVSILTDEVLGIKTNARSANWFAKVGTEKHHLIIAGCQIHYAMRCEERPSSDGTTVWDYNPDKVGIHKTPNRIYFTE